MPIEKIWIWIQDIGMNVNLRHNITFLEPLMNLVELHFYRHLILLNEFYFIYYIWRKKIVYQASVIVYSIFSDKVRCYLRNQDHIVPASSYLAAVVVNLYNYHIVTVALTASVNWSLHWWFAFFSFEFYRGDLAEFWSHYFDMDQYLDSSKGVADIKVLLLYFLFYFSLKSTYWIFHFEFVEIFPHYISFCFIFIFYLLQIEQFFSDNFWTYFNYIITYPYNYTNIHRYRQWFRF